MLHSLFFLLQFKVKLKLSRSCNMLVSKAGQANIKSQNWACDRLMLTRRLNKCVTPSKEIWVIF